MARRKGKSRRRIRDWNQRLGEDDVLDVPTGRQSLRRRAVKLGQEAFAAGEDDPSGFKQREGMVVGVFRRGAQVRIDGQEHFCGIAKTFRAPEGASPLAVGDVAVVALAPDELTDGRKDLDRDRVDGMILSRRPRESALSRPRPVSGRRRDPYDAGVFEIVIAANMDVLLIVAATREPPLRHGLIDRFLIIAERGELEPVLVVNKIDLGHPDEKVLADFQALEIRIVLCSAETGEGIDELREALTGRRSVLAGASGVGKSTLINALVPGADVVTRAVRTKDQRGRHTTTTATVYELPRGGILVDTPGIRELGIPLQAHEIGWYFPEFETLADHCRFNDCTHTHEPGCAVVEAVERGEIPPRRYDSYLTMLAEVEPE